MKKILLLISISLLAKAWSFGQQTCATAQLIAAGSYTIPSINGTEVPLLVCSTGGTVRYCCKLV
jgi:hypothetical protein